MRRLRELNAYRDKAWEARLIAMHGAETLPQDLGGCFIVPSPRDSGDLRVIAAVGDGWDHISVSRDLRIPSWLEMEHVKRLFFKPDEIAFQLHVPAVDHINFHPHCLHIWRPLDAAIPLPPQWMVA